MRLADEITKALEADPTGDPTRLAMVVVDRVTKADLVGLVADEIAMQQRAGARRRERAAFAQVLKSKTKDRPAVTQSIPEGLRALFRTPFKLGDGEEVEWLHATVDQHRQRIEHLSKMRAGIDRTIDQHRQAVALIESAGATCLAEISEVVAEVA